MMNPMEPWVKVMKKVKNEKKANKIKDELHAKGHEGVAIIRPQGSVTEYRVGVFDEQYFN